MFSIETIKEMNRKVGREAKSNGKKPLLIESVNTEQLRQIPNIGDYRPKGWILVDTLFVDSSGLGAEDELALTFSKFVQRVKVGFGYAIIEAGQFQVYIGEFKRVGA